MRFEARLPQPEPKFLANSVLFAGARWESLYRDVRADPSARLLVMRNELASIPNGMNEYEATNLWMLCAALAHGPEKLRFLCLWDGEGGEGPGGTKHMFDLAHKISGKPAIQIKPQELRRGGNGSAELRRGPLEREPAGRER